MKESFNKITHTNNSVTEKLFEDDLQKKIDFIETFLHDWFEIIFTVLNKESAQCRQHSQTI
jgi:hypothetical protein